MIISASDPGGSARSIKGFIMANRPNYLTGISSSLICTIWVNGRRVLVFILSDGVDRIFEGWHNELLLRIASSGWKAVNLSLSLKFFDSGDQRNLTRRLLNMNKRDCARGLQEPSWLYLALRLIRKKIRICLRYLVSRTLICIRTPSGLNITRT